MHLVILGDSSYGTAFAGPHHKRMLGKDSILPDVNEYDMVVFTGGTDVDPALYGHKKLTETMTPDTKRDSTEVRIFEDCLKHAVPMVGICRGSQFLNVMNGGWLVQDCTGHTINHSIRTREPGFEALQVSSTHHQMMVPTEHAVWEAWAEGLSSKYSHANEEKPRFPVTPDGKPKEPEVIFYPETFSLCVQYHPEFMSAESPGYQYFNRLIFKYLMEARHV